MPCVPLIVVSSRMPSCRQEDELTFEAGDLLYVKEPSADQVWWTASCGNSTGLVPYNYRTY